VDIYNIPLRAANCAPISDIHTENYLLAQLEPLVNAVKRRVLLSGYPFNTHTVTLTPDNEGEIAIPQTYLAIRFPSHLQERLTIYNGKVYDRTTQEYYSSSLEVQAVLDIALEQIPELYAEWIAREAAVEFVVQVNGTDGTFPFWQRQATLAKVAALNSEPIQALDAFSGFTQVRSAFGS
jgi:hypothetical protein